MQITLEQQIQLNKFNAVVISYKQLEWFIYNSMPRFKHLRWNSEALEDHSTLRFNKVCEGLNLEDLNAEQYGDIFAVFLEDFNKLPTELR